MLENVFSAQALQGLARRKKRKDFFKSVPHALVEEQIAQGWIFLKKNKNSSRLSKPKPPHVLLEDRVWTLLYRLGFSSLSGEKGAYLVLDNKNPSSPANPARHLKKSLTSRKSSLRITHSRRTSLKP